MIGDKIPEEDNFWKLHIYMRDIINIVMSPKTTESLIKILEQKIEEHNELYIEICQTLQSKLHLSCHYPSIMRSCGPLIHLWSMRFEGLNVNIKKNVLSTSNKKNILATVAIKQTLSMFAFNHNFQHEAKVKFFSHDEPENFVELEPFDDIKFYKQIEIDAVTYRLGSFFILDSSKDVDILLKFGKVVKIIKIEDHIILNIKKYEEVTFNDHFYAHEVRPGKEEPFFVNVKDLPNIPECSFVQMTGGQYIVPKYRL